ncbi:uncharacterized protein BDZ99DRAFT_191598 [Mytilinidion resinicola]|uniref:Ig-like domain-containing protein n=1 Tax=Mytilinidion resinicola TaxID=574789 RepID=A0A6A6Z4R2_9PEZI|nr:uncharacterized protein BDZ99DRAFT_191598 [Mytilinidion resinicola]KAF2815165.1 hypothetical protein BDZ99DRAFT_191598 [Mytilinidion resinicola]
MFFRAAVGVPLLLSTLASAATNGTYPASTTTNLHCTTKMGRHSACPVPTCTKLWTVEAPPVIIPSYTQTTLTHTGNASTITSTETIQATATVTASTITDTFSTTSSEYDTITETTSTTTTFTETDTVTTTSTFTSVVPTESGFQFVSDTLNGYPGTAQKRNNWNQLEARGANSTEHGVPKKDYPQSVECSAEIMVQSTKMVTVTLSPTITIVTPVPSSTTVQTTASLLHCHLRQSLTSPIDDVYLHYRPWQCYDNGKLLNYRNLDRNHHSVFHRDSYDYYYRSSCSCSYKSRSLLRR